jgi:hypothetical protein
MKSMRAAVSKASPGQSPAVDDTDAQACVTEQMHSKHRPAEPTTDDQNVDLRVTH